MRETLVDDPPARTELDEASGNRLAAAQSGPLAASWLLALALSVVVVLSAPVIREWCLELVPDAPEPEAAETADAVERRIRRLEARLRARQPGRAYLIVSTTDNKIVLRRADGSVHEGVCSTGSYVELRAESGRTWIFETPRGAFTVKKKVRNPVWVKPDWAFVEEGRSVPPPGAPERYARGVLGAYSLALGDGYLIHGTLYQRLLGLPVTHGCVRLGDEDLKIVYHTLSVGSPVYIY